MAHATTRRKDIDLVRVREAVEAAELRTSTEIAVSIAPFFIGRVWPAARRAFARLASRPRVAATAWSCSSRRQVVVLADDGALARIDAAVWDDVAARIAAAFARGHGTASLIDAIDRLSRAVSGPFPRERTDVNELPDQPFQGRL